MHHGKRAVIVGKNKWWYNFSMASTTKKAIVPVSIRKCKNPKCTDMARGDWRGRPREYCSKLCETTAIKCGFVVAGPTHYIFKLEYCNEILGEFLEWCEDQNAVKFIPVPGPLDKNGQETVAYVTPRNSACLPTLPQYSRWLEKYKKVYIPLAAMKYWVDSRPAFAEAYERMKAMQDVLLTNNGLSRFYDSSLTTFSFSRIGVQEPAKPQALSLHNHYHLDAIKKVYELADQEEQKEYGEQH